MNFRCNYRNKICNTLYHWFDSGSLSIPIYAFSHNSQQSYHIINLQILLLKNMWCLHKAYHFLCLVLFFLNSQANLSSSSSSITQLCSHDEASALIQFKSSFSINETYSDAWNCDFLGTKSYPKTDSWKEGTDCCSWDGVTCDNIKGQDRKSTRLNSSHFQVSRMPSSA